MPVLRVSKSLWDGQEDIEAPTASVPAGRETEDGGDEIYELNCNLDDMTPEALGFAQERLLNGGALDVFTTPSG
jgi:uncharacterized protein (DUF111 family)